MENIKLIIVVLSLIINVSVITTFFVLLERRLTKLETIQKEVLKGQIAALFHKIKTLEKDVKLLLSRSLNHRKLD